MKKLFLVFSVLLLSASLLTAQMTTRHVIPTETTFGGFEYGSMWMPQTELQKLQNPFGVPTMYSMTATAQLPNVRIELSDSWSTQTFGQTAREYLYTNCHTLPNGTTKCEQVFRDTNVERSLKTGAFSASAMYLHQLGRERSWFLHGGIGLRVNGTRNPQLQIDQYPNRGLEVIVRKDVVFQPDFIGMLQLRKNFTRMKGEWNSLSELSFETQGGFNDFGFAPLFKTRTTYNVTNWLYMGADVRFMAIGSDYSQNSLNLIIGGYVWENLNVCLSSGINSIARQATAPEGEKSHNLAISVRYGF